MGKLMIEYVPIDSIKFYVNNSKIHTPKQIEQIKKSIAEFNFNDPIAVWNNEVVEGHGRLEAAKQLGMDTVPIIRLDDLTDEQRKAYGLVHNQLTMNTGLDLEALSAELDGISSIDMQAFDFDVDDINLEIEEKEEKHQQEKGDYMVDLAKIENIHKGIFEGVGKYDMPILEPVTELPPIKEWISFNYVLSDKNPEGKAVHFFIDDYQFERVWRQPEKYLDKLKQYVCVATPDFSPYSDMPLILQMYSHYKKQWVGRWLQYNGVTVIPTIRSSTDKRSFEWYLDGIPKGGIVIMSSMWCDSRKDEEQNESDRYEYEHMKEVIQPKKIFIYGRKSEKMGILDTDNVEYITNFSDSRWNNGKGNE